MFDAIIKKSDSQYGLIAVNLVVMECVLVTVELVGCMCENVKAAEQPDQENVTG